MKVFYRLLALLFCIHSPLSFAVVLKETPSLLAQVDNGVLPPIGERIPKDPWIVDLQTASQEIGIQGGDLKMLMGKEKDVRMMTVYGYARLIGYDETLNLRADILAAVEEIDNRIFTLRLRRGHKWSDGHPFTTDAFRYYWENIVNNKDLSPFGPPKTLLVEGQPPTVEIIDEITVRYSWDKPNPFFLPALAAPRPLYIYRPGHYLKQFHADFQDIESLNKKAKDAGAKSWAGLHLRRDKAYKQNNPELPVLQPWVTTTAPPSDRYVFRRNPFYHRIDTRGQQLPYINKVIINISSASLVPAKTGAGESDLQARNLRLDNYTFLKAGEKRNNYTVHLWRKGAGSQIALYPNLNSSDAVWRELARDKRFRRALSLAINRHEVNQVIYFGLVIESNNTVLPSCPLFKPHYQTAWADFDPAKANELLDEIGLAQRDDRGIRLMSDGRPLEITLHSAGESTEETDALELIHDSWLDVGIKLYTRPSQREVFRNRIFSGEAMMSISKGVDNGLPTANMSPAEFTPSSQVQLQWPKWGQYFETNAGAGEAPNLESAKELVALNDDWRNASSLEQRRDAWDKILNIHSEEVFSIGIVCGVPQPVVVNNELNNVPVEGIYSWEPTAYFGVYRPDTFWFNKVRR